MDTKLVQQQEDCPNCQGVKYTETRPDINTIRRTTCRYCHGTGKNPHPVLNDEQRRAQDEYKRHCGAENRFHGIIRYTLAIRYGWTGYSAGKCMETK